MPVVVLGAGAVGTATAWYLSKAGHEVTVVERQDAAALETSWGNGGVIHASEVEPWSQPGMPLKILKWLGKENAPLLLRYGAIPHMWRWGLAFARNCTPERFAANSRANLELALYSLRSLQEIGAETGIAYDRATRGVLKIYRSKESLDGRGARLRRARASTGCATSGSTSRAASSSSRRSTRHAAHAGRRALLRARRGGRLQQVHAGAGGGLRGARRALPLWRRRWRRSRRRSGRVRASMTSAGRHRGRHRRRGAWQLHGPAARQARHPRADLSGEGRLDHLPARRLEFGARDMPVIDDSKLFGLVPIGDRMRISGSAEITGYDTTPAPARAEAIIANASFTFPELTRHLDLAQGAHLGGAAAGQPGRHADHGAGRAQGAVGQCRPRTSRLDAFLRLRPGRRRHGLGQETGDRVAGAAGRRRYRGQLSTRRTWPRCSDGAAPIACGRHSVFGAHPRYRTDLEQTDAR